MDDGYRSEGAYQVEVGHCLPHQCFTLHGILGIFAYTGTGLHVDILDDAIAVGVYRPEGSRHVRQVLIGRVDGEGEVGR